MFNHKLPTDFPMQTLRKKTSPCKYKNEPGRFLGEGVAFRAKLIGVLEVPEARGDRMCQEALADLKIAIRAAGEHKQRIQVHVAIDGLRLRDDKTGDSLYHHPVHKISFIAQDMTDSRAFGYIFGSPDTGHRFFGIKTDKAASQVVIAMRDLFQVVFELKKKEIELAKQQLECKNTTCINSRHASTSSELTKIKTATTSTESNTTSKPTESGAEGGVAELVDLEQELSSLRRGLTLVEGLTPSSDPFGDSFIVPPSSSSSKTGLLPPPPSGSSSRGRNTPATTASKIPIFSPSRLSSTTPTSMQFDIAPTSAEYVEASSSFVDNLNEPIPTSSSYTIPSIYDVFTELDPLGTGRSKPYVDKKLFFQELKNPPKKVLKDLVPTTNTSTNLLSDILPAVSLPTVTTTVETVKGDQTYSATTITSVPRQSGGSVSIVKPTNTVFNSTLFSSDPFAETDPFDSADPFSDTFKDDPFVGGVQELSKNSMSNDEIRRKLRDYGIKNDEKNSKADKSVFNGPLQVTLPPEPTPKSPRLQRQTTDTSSIRQRPQRSNKLNSESASPPPPLPPKKLTEVTNTKPPPRPPHDPEYTDSGAESGPPLPRPSRRRDTPTADRAVKPRRSSGATNSSEDEYLTPIPPPLPGGRRFDITLSQLLTCGLDDLATRLRVPASTLSSMTLPQLTTYLRSYLAADAERANINVEYMDTEKDKSSESISKITSEFKSNFEDDFEPTHETNGSFVANFDDFDKKANPTYDRYAAFREIQEQELTNKSILDPLVDQSKQNGDSEQKEDSDDKEVNNIHIPERKDLDKDRDSHSPLKSLDELTLDSFNMFRNSVSPKPSKIDAKIEDIKCVMKNLQIEQCRRSVSPRDCDDKVGNDRYAALREITITTTEPHDEYESLPSEAPKEHDAFRKSPVVKEKIEVIEKKELPQISQSEIVREAVPQPARLSTGSMSEIASGSSPDTKERSVSRRSGGGRWSVLAAHCSSDSKDSESAPPPRPTRRRHHHCRSRHTSSSSRDVSPWEEEPPPARHHRGHSHHRESRHNSSGSRECLDSGSGRDKDKIRDKRDSRDRDRESRDSGSTRERDRRDSGSGRDRDRDIRTQSKDRRDKRRDKDGWDRDYSRDRDYRDSRSRERLSKDYREKERDRHRKQQHSWDDEEDYSDGGGSGRSSPRERWADHRDRRWREDRNYGSLGWRESRRRPELPRQNDENLDRRYGATLAWGNRRTTSSSRRESDRRRQRREDRDRGRTRDHRFSNDFSPRDHGSPFDNDFNETLPKKRAPYSSLEATRFAFESEENTASPLSAGSRPRDGDSPATRFRFDSDSVSPRSMFEDDFTAVSTPRARAASIAEEDEGDLPPLRMKQTQSHRDIKKSESVNIFVRESDPFEGDDFFACTGSDRAARRENWPGDFHAFDNI